jgi:hypothetical protein
MELEISGTNIMCGRFALYSSPKKIQSHFATADEVKLEPHYNIAPAQTLAVVRADETGRRIFTPARWGLIPSWVEDTDELQQPINAKAETAPVGFWSRRMPFMNGHSVTASSLTWSSSATMNPWVWEACWNAGMALTGRS